MTTYRDSEADASRAPAPRRRTVERDSWWPILGPGLVLGLLAAAGIVASCLFAWRDPDLRPDDIPLAFLWDSSRASQHPSLILVLLPAAALLAIGALTPWGGMLRLIGGLAAPLVAGLFAFQLDDATADLGSALETGFYVAAIAGILGVIAGVVPGAWAHRRTVDVEEDGGADPAMWGRRRR